MGMTTYMLKFPLQAIAIACCFMSEGSVLVVCPAVLRFTWAEELERWVPSCLPADIHLGNTFNFSFIFVPSRGWMFWWIKWWKGR